MKFANSNKQHKLIQIIQTYSNVHNSVISELNTIPFFLYLCKILVSTLFYRFISEMDAHLPT